MMMMIYLFQTQLSHKICLGMCLGLDILFLASGRLDFVKSLHFHLYCSSYIELVGAHVGRANVLHGLLEFAKLLRIV
jgi:hypothetical protein